VDDAAAVRLAGLDRDDWFIPPQKRERAWAALRAAEMDASFAARAAASSPGRRRPAGFARGLPFDDAGGGAEPKPRAAQAPPQNPFRALLKFSDEARIAELAALDSDDLLFLADMERTGWDEDDCLCKWTLHPRVGPRLRATAGLGGGGEQGGFGFDESGAGGRLERGARGGAGAFFGGLPESLRTLMDEARAAAAEERAGGGGRGGGRGGRAK
jgi:hypothetical protein